MRSVESLVNSRFQVTQRPVVSPGKCASCGSVERPVVDFGLDIDFYGTVYLCVDCISEAFNAMVNDGAVPETQPAALPTWLIRDLNEYRTAAMGSIAALHAFLNSVSGSGTNDLPSIDDANGDESDSPEQSGPTLFDTQGSSVPEFESPFG